MQTENPVLKARKTLGYTQSEMARALGVNISTIVRWEKGYLGISHRTQLAVDLLVKQEGAAA